MPIINFDLNHSDKAHAICQRIPDGFPDEAFDSTVDDIMSKAAARINNGGWLCQVDLMLETGIPEEEILKLIEKGGDQE